MSSTLARLRKLLDDPILVRDGRQMVPTPLALSLITPVREVLDRIDAIVSPSTAFDPAAFSAHSQWSAAITPPSRSSTR